MVCREIEASMLAFHKVKFGMHVRILTVSMKPPPSLSPQGRREPNKSTKLQVWSLLCMNHFVQIVFLP